MELSRNWIKQYIGQGVNCHTHYGTFQGVVIRVTKHHLILGMYKPAPHRFEDPMYDAPMMYDEVPVYMNDEDDLRQMRMGPGGPIPPGYGGYGGYGPGGGGGWQFAVPLAAILGITALGMHWW